MKFVETVLLDNIDKPNSCFIFPTDTAASRWADHLLRLSGGTVAMDKFTAWDVFKQNSIKSKVQNKKSIPSALRKIFICRLIRKNADLCEQGKTPLFTSLIPVQWAEQSAQFASWLTALLPQIGTWFTKTTGLTINNILDKNTELAGLKLTNDDRDMLMLAQSYAQFLDAHRLFEPAWETPPFNNDGKECFIFFPESLADYNEYKELLESSRHVKTISVTNAENLPCDAFFYTNSRSEITEAALYIRALHEKQGVNWDSILVCIPDSENYEAYVLREFTNRNIPFVKRISKPLAHYQAGQFFSSVINCTSRNYAFSALVSLILNRNLPWKDTEQIHNLIEFGIKNNCIASWAEEKDGKKQIINVWEDAFNQPFGGVAPDCKFFFVNLKRHLQSLRTAASFSEVRRQYFAFRERFFNMDECSDETDLVLSRCISELMYLCEIEKDYPDIPAVDPFLFFTEYLNEVNYLAQTEIRGVTIHPYKAAAAAPFDCHVILSAGHENLSIINTRLNFLPRKKREKLGIKDEDASSVFINLHKYNSIKPAAFFCSQQTFSSFSIPYSKTGCPSEPRNRYAAELAFKEKFSEDYYNAEYSFDNTKPEKLHENQNAGFENWKKRRWDNGISGKWHTEKILLKLIRKKYFYDSRFPDKYGVSASSLAPYFKCSIKWLFNRVLALENLEIETNLMAENIVGMVYHAVLNNFLLKIKDSKKPLANSINTEQGLALPKDYRDLLTKCVDSIFTGFPSLHINNPGTYGNDKKIQMSALTARLLNAGKANIQINIENCLAHFISLFSGCYVAGCEISYRVPQDKYFLDGKLDCILIDTDNRYIVIDFKLKWTPERTDCTGEGENGLVDFQLPMYTILAEAENKIKVHTTLFYSILNLEPKVIIGTVDDKYNETIIPKKETDHILIDTEKYNQLFDEFNNKTKQFIDEISTGDFTVFESKYNKCNNCNYNRICRTVYIINHNKNIHLGNSNEKPKKTTSIK